MAFSFFSSVAQAVPFRSRFTGMVLLSLGIALLSFGVGYAMRRRLGIEL